jgi:hypothetical protein
MILIIGAFLNFVAILYLGLLHQRAPIDVNRAILKTVKGFTQPATVTRLYRVHYLMGCHSTPLLSHLHLPPVKFETWYLDCSPSCRADPTIDCESDAFSKNPQEFIQRKYFKCVDGDETGTETCTALVDSSIGKEFPDFVVCSAGDVGQIKSTLNSMRMKETGRFVNGINGIKLGNYLTLGSDSFVNADFTKMSVFATSITVGLDEMILFQRETIL